MLTQEFQRQEEDLSHLSTTLKQIDGVGQNITEELADQHKILDGMDISLRANEDGMRFIVERTKRIVRHDGSRKQCGIIAFLVVVVIVLVVLICVW